jgi:acyl carrier protein
MEDKINEVISNIFGTPLNEINGQSSPDTIENWDSINHMKLITALEEEFDVEFTDEEILEMQNVKLIKYILSH